MTQTTFIYFVFGNNFNNYTMNNFSMLTIKKLAPQNSKFVVYTDRPQFYKCNSSFVETRLMDENKLKDWKGKHNFLWRVKIKAMLDSAQTDAGHIVYLDSDTVAFSDLSPMITEMEKGASFMHLKESLLSEDKASHKSLMWEQTKNKKFGGMLVHEKSAMWNAGVVAINEKDKVRLLNQALSSTDEMCDQNVTQWLIEQFSLSQSLASTNNLKPADQYFAHYWGNKEEWIHKIDVFFSEVFQKGNSVDEVIKDIDIEKWKAIPIMRYKKSWGRKLLKFADKYFKDSVTYTR
jgi:hypothetical protein